MCPKSIHEFILISAVLCAKFALGADDGKRALSYMEQTNGLFQVAVIDRGTSEYAVYRGVFVEKSELPCLSPIFRQTLICACPERRVQETINKEPWTASQEDLYRYAKPLFPVVERNPQLEVYRLKDGRIIVGFRLISDLFVMDELEEENLPTEIDIQEGFAGGIHPVVETDARKMVVEDWWRSLKTLNLRNRQFDDDKDEKIRKGGNSASKGLSLVSSG